MSEDHAVVLKKHTEHNFTLSTRSPPNEESDLVQSLNWLGHVFTDLEHSHHTEEGLSAKFRIERKSFTSIESRIRNLFKAAIDADLRYEWNEALKSYQEAYHTLREAATTKTISSSRSDGIQYLLAIKCVAEQLHFKISFLLLLQEQKIVDAVTWFCQHKSSFGCLVESHELVFLHWGWMARQFLAFAELLEACYSTTSPTVSTTEIYFSDLELQPAYYYQQAAHYMMVMRSSFKSALSVTEIVVDIGKCHNKSEESVYIGLYGQILKKRASAIEGPPSEEDYNSLFFCEGKRILESFNILEVLKQSAESYAGLKSWRMVCYCKYMIAKEYFSHGDLSSAKELFDSIVSLHRKEGWVWMVWDVFGYLRESCRKQGLVKEFVEYSLEMATLPDISDASGIYRVEEDRESVQTEAFKLVKGEMKLETSENSFGVSEEHSLHLQIDLASPLRTVFLISVAFHEQTVRLGTSTFLTLSLVSYLPLVVEIDELEVEFNRPDCNFSIVSSLQKYPGNSSRFRRIEIADNLSLVGKRWLRLTYSISSNQSGKLECTSVLARIGPSFTICCVPESPASINGLPFWKFEDHVDRFPTKDHTLSFMGQKAIQVEESNPLVELSFGSAGPALVGECFSIPVTISSKGHSFRSGELKINLVDPRGGILLNPMDDPHVEFVGVSVTRDEDTPEYQAEGKREIQQSFQYICVPFLDIGETWMCEVLMKWHYPKVVTLYALLSYNPHPDAQKVHIHKNMEIEGQTAVEVSHDIMFPFQQDAFLEQEFFGELNSTQFSETSLVAITVNNKSNVALELRKIHTEAVEGDLVSHTPLMPGEVFKKVLSVANSSTTNRVVHVIWKRLSGGILTTDTVHNLDYVGIDLCPLTVSTVCPPHAIIGNPFNYCLRIENPTELLQNVKFSLEDSQNFLSSGSHDDTIFVLPRSFHIIKYEIVPLASGLLVTPRVYITATRYSDVFGPLIESSSIFVFPSEQQFNY